MINLMKDGEFFNKKLFKNFSLFAHDYLSLRNKPVVLKIMAKYDEDKENDRCYSDYMIRINRKENKEKRVIFITRKKMKIILIMIFSLIAKSFYNLHPKKNYKMIRRIALEKIYKITICEDSAVLCAIHVSNE